MKAFIVEEDVVFLVIELEQLSSLLRALRRHAFREELGLLRSLEVYFRCGSHCSSCVSRILR